MDTWGTQAEYIPHGLDFDKAINRTEEFVRDIPTEVVLLLSLQ